MGIYVDPENRKYLWLTSALLFAAAFGIKLVARQMPKDSDFLKRRPGVAWQGPSSEDPLALPRPLARQSQSPAEAVSLFVFFCAGLPIWIILKSRQFDKDNEML
ncbi:MAG: hypothetical protein U0S12_03625 [Fimbriimonadales bacterium]